MRVSISFANQKGRTFSRSSMKLQPSFFYRAHITSTQIFSVGFSQSDILSSLKIKDYYYMSHVIVYIL